MAYANIDVLYAGSLRIKISHLFSDCGISWSCKLTFFIIVTTADDTVRPNTFCHLWFWSCDNIKIRPIEKNVFLNQLKWAWNINCKFGNFRDNFIFANSFKSNHCDFKISRLRHTLPISVNGSLISSFRVFHEFRENKTLAKIFDFTATAHKNFNNEKKKIILAFRL